eukprot:CAMPEP_0195296622 /NCGR_PEP_ID=MMETSP0707-20130614/19847_1 /TAXON_ID=33640 /ORGANISM="Asterionellopsis glacialis, Strain CCMP134" /LENGTH=287 /DNA_ID=CAMNT_0040358191 /DNA_START=285 /DNA_END=1145 /DNA_ORIENTATION=+
MSSRRALLAFLWSCVTIITFLSFLLAGLTAVSRNASNKNDDDYNNNNEEQQDAEIAVSSRALSFTALWTACLATVIAIFGAVILGFQSPTGTYYTCCTGKVHRTTPLGLGSFIGALLVFGNCTLVTSVLFGEFEIKDYIREGEEADQDDYSNEEIAALERASVVFSIMCMFLTVLYTGFAGFTFVSSKEVLEEFEADAREEALYGGRGSSLTGAGRAAAAAYNIGQHLDVMGGVTAHRSSATASKATTTTSNSEYNAPPPSSLTNRHIPSASSHFNIPGSSLQTGSS